MAVVYSNLETGTTTLALTPLTTCVASNPSGTITRINKVGHGLTTGQIVRLTLFSTWLNNDWSVSVVDADNFDLVEAVWQTTADNNGTVTPYNGYSWATAVKEPGTFHNTISSLQMDIEVRVEKSPDPYSIGNATWTNGSGTVTLATAQTTTVDNCEVAWTAANSATVTRITTSPVKQGTYRAQIVLPASGVTTSTKYGFYNLGTTLDLSAYQKISFWAQGSTSSSMTGANQWKICLCSDTNGDTIVDEFYIPQNNFNGGGINRAFSLSRNGGGNLGSSIQSIALYTHTSAPSGSTGVRLDNIIACTATGLNLTSVISKCDVATYDHSKDPWHPIDYINGTDIQLSSTVSQNWNDTVISYYKYSTTGTSPETVTTYAREPIFILNPPSFVGAKQTPKLNSTTGGWDSSNSTQNGMTFIIGNTASFLSDSSGGSSGNNSRFALIENFGIIDYAGLVQARSLHIQSCYAKKCHVIRAASRRIYCNAGLFDMRIEDCTFNNQSSGDGILFNNSQSIIKNVKSINTTLINEILVRNNSTIEDLYMWSPAYNTSNGHRIYAYSSYANNITIRHNTSPAGQGPYGLQLASGGVTSYEQSVLNNVTIQNCRRALLINQYCNTVLNNPTFIGNTNTVNLDLNQISSAYTDIYINGSSSTDTNLFEFTGSTTQFMQPLRVFMNAIGDNPDSINTYFKLLGTPMVSSSAWGATVQAQTSVRKSASGIAWQINPLTTWLTESMPFLYKVASVAVNASSLVTAKIWMKLSHATDIGAKLFIPGGQISGPSTDTTATKTADTNWEELTITFTPSIKGVVDIYIEAYWRANAADESVYIDDITVSQ